MYCYSLYNSDRLWHSTGLGIALCSTLSISDLYSGTAFSFWMPFSFWKVNVSFGFRLKDCRELMMSYTDDIYLTLATISMSSTRDFIIFLTWLYTFCSYSVC